MLIPKLKKSKRSREYNLYNDEQRAGVVKGWLFEGRTHRQLDEEVLGMDRAISKGYQSMGILHYLGLKKQFRGLFQNMQRELAVEKLESDQQDFSEVVLYIKYDGEAGDNSSGMVCETTTEYKTTEVTPRVIKLRGRRRVH